MQNLTQRQIEILKAIVEEYIETAEPVGSETLEKKHNLIASPATIRNEMVRLSNLGYIKKPHSSSGRIPTSMGMKFYVRQLMKEKELSVVEEVALKEKVWDYREKTQQFLRETAKLLAGHTHALAIATTNQGDFYCAGYANILDMPEFYDIDATKTLLTAMDEYDYVRGIFENVKDDEDIHILIGEELGQPMRGPYGVVFTHFTTPSNISGDIAVIGPVRLNYMRVVPAVRYFGDLIESIAKDW